MNRITEAATLLEQGRKLRELARRLDHPIMKDDVLRLAERCAELAETANDATVQRWHYETAASTAVASSHRAPQPGTIEEISEPTHESLKSLHAYWLAKRGFRIAPPRSVIRLERMAALLPDITLMDVVGDPPRFRYRLCGTNVAKTYGEDVTGKFLDEMDFGPLSLKGNVVSFVTEIVQECRPQAVRIRYTKQQDERYLDYERIALPLSQNGRTVTTILCAYAFRRPLFNAVSGSMLRPPA